MRCSFRAHGFAALWAVFSLNPLKTKRFRIRFLPDTEPFRFCVIRFAPLRGCGDAEADFDRDPLESGAVVSIEWDEAAAWDALAAEWR